MDAPTLFPGQTLHLTYNEEQLEALTSVARSNVLWGFNENKPLSAAEVAKLIGKSPQSVHSHVNRLVEVGLLLAVETRKKRSRTERAYVYAARELYTPSPPYSSTCRQALSARFAALMRNLVREMTLAQIVMERDASFQAFTYSRFYNVMATEEEAREIRTFIQECLLRASGMAKGHGTHRITLSGLMLPVAGESAARYRELTGESIVDEASDE
jgi:predicted ArsR family transcriptional regulator